MTEHAAEQPSTRRRATRARLIEAAAEVFVEEGLQGASVEAVCVRAGFTRGAFYSNFASKEELFLAVLQSELERRARHLEAKALELEPELREQACRLGPAEAAGYVAEFFAVKDNATAWFVLETEFLLLTMREPSAAPGHQAYLDRFFLDISSVVERIIAAAGRRFTLPVERALPVLGDVYERALRISATEGEDAPGGLRDVGDRLAEVLFAITAELPEG